MAPAAELFLAYVTGNRDDFHAAVNWLIGQDVDVISMSLRVPFEGPGDGTSPVTNSHISAANNAISNGTVWVNSAGNYGERSWLISGSDVQFVRERLNPGSRNPPEFRIWIDFNTGPGTNITNYVRSNISPNTSFGTTLDLRWHNGSELHLARFDANGNMISREAQRLYGEGEPAKFLQFNVGGSAGFRVWTDGDTVPDWIQLVSYDPTRLTWDSADGGVNAPSDSHNGGMMAVGA